MHPLRPAPRETLPSYLSRLAASKGVRTADFALDLGGSFKRFLRCDPQAIEALAGWAGLTHEGTEELLSWTGAPLGEVRMAYRGETVISRALRNPIVQGCPECLRDDAMLDHDEPLAATVMRGDWQMREVSVCLCHSKLLVPLWTEDLPAARFDIQAQLSRILGRIIAGEMDGAPVQPSPFDIWLNDRLEGKADPTWMASHSTSASAAFCRMLGQGLMNPGPDDDQIRWLHEAAAAGFAVIKDGPDAIKSFVVSLSTQSAAVADPIQQVLGQTIYALETHLLEDTSFDIFRSILRDAVLEIWAIAAGEIVLGVTLIERKRHSVLSASAELSIHADRLRPMLVEAGALAADDPRPDARATFDAKTFVSLLKEIPHFITKKAMCEVLGASSAELDGLEAAGVLRPRTFVPGARRRWLAADAGALLDELQILAGRVADDVGGGGWTTILNAQARRGVSVEKVIAGIRAGEIQLRQTNPDVGYRGFQIAVDSLFYTKRR